MGSTDEARVAEVYVDVPLRRRISPNHCAAISHHKFKLFAPNFGNGRAGAVVLCFVRGVVGVLKGQEGPGVRRIVVIIVGHVVIVLPCLLWSVVVCAGPSPRFSWRRHYSQPNTAEIGFIYIM